VSVALLLPFVDRECLNHNDRQLLKRALDCGTVDLWVADRMLTRSGRPEMLSILYGDVRAAA
jgi:hypothetical protein